MSGWVMFGEMRQMRVSASRLAELGVVFVAKCVVQDEVPRYCVFAEDKGWLGRFLVTWCRAAKLRYRPGRSGRELPAW
jgi:hypothetical protein